MASSVLRNDQQVKQPPPLHTDTATGSGKVINSQLGTGSGKVINGIEDLAKNNKAAVIKVPKKK